MDADSLPGARGSYSLPRRLRRVLHAVALGCPPHAVHDALGCSESAGRTYVSVLREYNLIPCHGFAPPHLRNAAPLTPKGVEWLSKNPREKADYVYDWSGRPRDSREHPPTREQAMTTAIQNAREALDRAGISRGRKDTIARRIDVLARLRDSATRYSHERAAVERFLLRYGLHPDTFPEGLRQVEVIHREQMREHTDKIDARVRTQVEVQQAPTLRVIAAVARRLEARGFSTDHYKGNLADTLDALLRSYDEAVASFRATIRRHNNEDSDALCGDMALRKALSDMEDRAVAAEDALRERDTKAGEYARTIAGLKTTLHVVSQAASSDWYEALHPWTDAARLALLTGECAASTWGGNVSERIARVLTAVEQSPEALGAVHKALAVPVPPPTPASARLYGFDADGNLTWEANFPLDGKTASMEFPHQPSIARMEIDALPSGWRIQGNVTVREIGADSQSGVHVRPIASEPGCGVSCDYSEGTAVRTVVVNLRAVEAPEWPKAPTD
jgi:hypothetical protein